MFQADWRATSETYWYEGPDLRGPRRRLPQGSCRNPGYEDAAFLYFGETEQSRSLPGCGVQDTDRGGRPLRQLRCCHPAGSLPGRQTRLGGTDTALASPTC